MRVLLLVAGLACALVAGGAQPARKEAAVKPSGGTVLTPAQLKDCLAQKERLRTQTDDALKDKASIEADQTEIARIGATLAEQLPTLDRTSADAVGAYNGKLAERDKLIDTYQAKVTAYNLKAEGVRTTKDSYEKACENRRYDERDLNDLKRKK
ncbi:MAG: hypothetical protein ABI699_03130 [Caldimonas sp.]